MNTFDDIMASSEQETSKDSTMLTMVEGISAATLNGDVMQSAQEHQDDMFFGLQQDDELSKFNRESESRLAEIAAKHEQAAIERKEKAQSVLQQFIAERESRKEAKRAAVRAQEEATLEKLDADLKNENPWERVVTLIDLDLNVKKKKNSDMAASKNENTPATSQKSQKDTQRNTCDSFEDINRMRQLFLQLKCDPLIRVDSSN